MITTELAISDIVKNFSQRIQDVDLKASHANMADGVPVYTIATLPVAGDAGRIAYTSDSGGAVRYDNGSVWTALGASLFASVDNVTIEIAATVLRVKADGISANELAPDIAQVIRSTGGGVSGAVGAGAEMQLSGGIAYFGGYNRTTSAYIVTSIYGTSITLAPNGTQELLVNTTGVYHGNQSTRYISDDATNIYAVGPLKVAPGGTQAALINATGIYPGNQTTRYIADNGSYTHFPADGVQVTSGGLSSYILGTGIYPSQGAAFITHTSPGGLTGFELNDDLWPSAGGAYRLGYNPITRGWYSLHVTNDVTLNATAYTNPDFVLEQHFTKKIERWANQPGALTYKPLTINDVMDHAEKHWSLPYMPEFPNSDGGIDVFKVISPLTLNLELAMLFIADLTERVATLEGAN